MSKIVVNKSLCIGCGACIARDEKHFKYGADGLSEVKIQIEGEPTPELIDTLDVCPTNAITIE